MLDQSFDRTQGSFLSRLRVVLTKIGAVKFLTVSEVYYDRSMIISEK